MTGVGSAPLAAGSDVSRTDVPALLAAVHALKAGDAKRLQDFLKEHGGSPALASVLRDPWLLVLPGIVEWDTAERWPASTRISPANSVHRISPP